MKIPKYDKLLIEKYNRLLLDIIMKTENNLNKGTIIKYINDNIRIPEKGKESIKYIIDMDNKHIYGGLTIDEIINIIKEVGTINSIRINLNQDSICVLQKIIPLLVNYI